MRGRKQYQFVSMFGEELSEIISSELQVISPSNLPTGSGVGFDGDANGFSSSAVRALEALINGIESMFVILLPDKQSPLKHATDQNEGVAQQSSK